MRKGYFVALWIVVLGFCAQAQNPRPGVIVVLHSSQTMPAAMAKFKSIVGEDACNCSIVQEENLTPESLLHANAVFMQHPSQEMLERLKPAGLQALKSGLQIATDVPEFIVRNWSVEPTARLTGRLMPYWSNGGEANMVSFLMVMYKAAGGDLKQAIPPPVQVANKGIYHPDAPKLFPTMSEYLAWYRRAKPNQGGMVTVNFSIPT